MPTPPHAAGARRSGMHTGCYGAWLLAGILAFSTVSALGAQELELKRVLLAAGPEGCPPSWPVAAVAPEATERAALLLEEAQHALLVGEYTAALARLDETGRLDPSRPDLAYHRARLLEERGDLHAAAGEYCRVLGLEVEPGDALEVRSRLQALAEAVEGPGPGEQAVEWFRHAVAHHDRGDLGAAISTFSHIIALQPELAEPHYNRAVLHLARRQPGLAGVDLQAYLDLSPHAPDRAVVAQHLERLAPPARVISPPTALIGGLVVPGMGQFVTRRPARGALVTVGATGAVALALRSRETERGAGAPGSPVGDGQRRVEHPFRVAGIAAAVAITTFGAVEAYLYTRHRARSPAPLLATAPGERWRPVVDAAAGGVAVGLQLAVPR